MNMMRWARNLIVLCMTLWMAIALTWRSIGSQTERAIGHLQPGGVHTQVAHERNDQGGPAQSDCMAGQAVAPFSGLYRNLRAGLRLLPALFHACRTPGHFPVPASHFICNLVSIAPDWVPVCSGSHRCSAGC